MPSFSTKFMNATDVAYLTWHIDTPTAHRTETPKLGHGNWCNRHVNHVTWDTHNTSTTNVHHIANINGNWAYPTSGLITSIPTPAPSMYNYNPNPGINIPTRAQSTTSNASLESHMSQLSRTMLQLTQTKQVMVDHQQQNHQAMVTIQRQKTDAFNTLAAATEQRKYDALFAAILKYDGTNKKTAWYGSAGFLHLPHQQEEIC